MKNTQSGFVTIIVTGILVLILGSAVTYYFFNKKQYSDSFTTSTVTEIDKKQTPNTIQPIASSTQSSNKLYSNSKYNFQFSYPSNLELVEYQGSQECTKNTDNTNNDLKVAEIASINNVSILIVCMTLTSEIGNKNLDPSSFEKHEKISMITVGGKNSYKHVFTTATGYSWVVYQIPIDSNHYLEISESNGNIDRVNGDFPLTEKEWNIILSSFKESNI